MRQAVIEALGGLLPNSLLPHANAVLARLEDIAREASITEIASNSQNDDAVGADFHLAHGFAEAERVACFVRKLEG